jgi:hypothetical protein
VAATRSRKPGPGRPKGSRNQRTLAISATLDAAYAKVTRGILDEVVDDRLLAQLLWKLALEGDGRVATYLADRKWGRVKFEMEHSGPDRPFILLLGAPGAGMTIDAFDYQPMGKVPGMEPRSLPPVNGDGDKP